MWFQKELFTSILRNRFLKNYPKFFSIKILGLEHVTSLIKRLLYICFPVSFNKCLRAPSFALKSIVFQLQNLWYSSRLKDVIYNNYSKMEKSWFLSPSSLGSKVRHGVKTYRFKLFSYEFCEIFKNTYFVRHLWTAAFENHVHSDSIVQQLTQSVETISSHITD